MDAWHLRQPVASNPIVFFDLTIGGQAVGRIKIELFAGGGIVCDDNRASNRLTIFRPMHI